MIDKCSFLAQTLSVFLRTAHNMKLASLRFNYRLISRLIIVQIPLKMRTEPRMSLNNVHSGDMPLARP